MILFKTQESLLPFFHFNFFHFIAVVIVQSLSLTLCDPMNWSLLGFPLLHHLLEFAQTLIHWLNDASNHLILCHFLLLLLQSFLASRSLLMNLLYSWPKYWSLSFSISPFNEYSGLISFRTDGFDFLAVQGALKLILQHHSSKTSILHCSAFFMFQLSHPYMTTYWKIHSFDYTDFVRKVMFLLFNTLSRFVIAFLPRSKCLLISWLQSPSPVILEHKKIKYVPVSVFSPHICYEVMGPNAMTLAFWILSFKPVFSLSSFIFIKRFF